MSKQIQHRNSNLRELPVAPANTNMNNVRPAANVRPVAKATPGVRPGQQMPDGGRGRGRGQVVSKMESQPPGGRTVVRKEIPRTPLDPNEDEETRQYRLKIEEQKRLREEILKTKEIRRQMQAGVRKKELLERISSQTPTPQIQPAQQNQQMPQPVQQQQQQQPQQLQQRQQPTTTAAAETVASESPTTFKSDF
ncbi:RNA-binding protein 33 [Notothenia coriiceps]|uniref:RNA-binding protein 33 n=1 Tax=Notothenia coriiceps TaxID=8208 RepID=A0A6I9NNZ4_9TELE|nr:PREDICTED: RNA-binding protein 33 [Notothenia coriiceps]